MSPLSALGISIMILCLTVMIMSHTRVTAEAQRVTDPTIYAEPSTSSTQSSAPLLAQERLPILVYHIVRPASANDNDQVKLYAITPELFNEQLSYLRDAGYAFIPLESLEHHLLRGTPLPPKPIVITFDDGWSDQNTYAVPILMQHNIPATFFVFTNAIGRHGFLTWGELKDMQSEGMTIGSHSMTHPYLTKITNEHELEREIIHSKEVLEQKLGTPITEFAYPFGQYDARSLELVKKAGYVSARGDFYHYGQSPDGIYELAAMNAPVTLARFKNQFP